NAEPVGLSFNGVQITYALSQGGTLLTASAGITDIFRIQIDPVAGTYTVELLENLDHSQVGLVEEFLPQGFPIIVTNGAGLQANSALQVSFQDDVPLDGGDREVPELDEEGLTGGND